MLNFPQKVIDNFSNKVSTLSFPDNSHLLMPIINGEASSQGSYFPKSLFQGETQLSESNLQVESHFEENLAKSRRSQQSIEVKRQIIRKMNEKILSLEKKSKNQKMDIFQFQACKNDLLLDFLEYQQSKRKHQEELAQKQDELNQDEKSFFFMKNQLPLLQTRQKERNTVNFSKKPSRQITSVQQKITDIKLTPIQIFIPMIKMIDIEIPLLNFGQNKIRQTGTTSPTKFTKESEDYFAGVSNQINSVYHREIQNDESEENLPLDSSISKSLNQARVLDLVTERSEKSLDYRQERGSDQYFVDDEDLINNLIERDVNYSNQVTERKIYENYERHYEENINKSFDKAMNKSFNCSLKDSVVEDELKLNSKISEKQSSNYQQKRISIDNQTMDFYKNKVIGLQQDLREKVTMISDLLKQNEVFVEEIEKLNSQDERKERVIENANLKVQILQEKVEQLQKYVKEVQETSHENSNKLMNEIYHLSNELQTKNQELGLMMDSMQVVEQNAYSKQKNLMKDIQNLQNTIHKMKEEIQYYKKRFQEEGIRLNFTEIQMIEEAIEDREKMYQTNMGKLKDIYESELSELKKRFSTLEAETKQVQEKNHHFIIESQLTRKPVQGTPVMEFKQEQIGEIMDFYDSELEKRDHEIIDLKTELSHCKMALFEALELLQQSYVQKQPISIQCQSIQADEFKSPHDELVIHLLKQKNRTLEDKLGQEIINRKQMTKKLFKLEKLIQSDPSTQYSNTIFMAKNQILNQHENSLENEDHEYDLIGALSTELDSLTKQLKKQKEANKRLRQKMNEQIPCSPTSQSAQIITLKQKLKKLTKYSGLLEKQIKEIYKVEECEAHQKIIKRLENQLKLNPRDRSSEKIESIIGAAS